MKDASYSFGNSSQTHLTANFRPWMRISPCLCIWLFPQRTCQCNSVSSSQKEAEIPSSPKRSPRNEAPCSSFLPLGKMLNPNAFEAFANFSSSHFPGTMILSALLLFMRFLSPFQSLGFGSLHPSGQAILESE